ncbi:transcription factor IIIA-like protein, partial [Lates japonicus]
MLENRGRHGLSHSGGVKFVRTVTAAPDAFTTNSNRQTHQPRLLAGAEEASKLKDMRRCTEVTLQGGEGCTFTGKTWTEHLKHRKEQHRIILKCDQCSKSHISLPTVSFGPSPAHMQAAEDSCHEAEPSATALFTTQRGGRQRKPRLKRSLASRH